MKPFALGKDVVPAIRQRLKEHKPGSHHTVLLVEDSFATRKLMRAVLEVEGFEVLEATTGVEAMAFARWNADVTIVLLDLDIDGGDGHLVIQEIEKLHKSTNIKSCVVSSSSEDAVIDLCINEGADDIVIKGIHSSILVHKLRNLIHSEIGDGNFKAILSNLTGTLEGLEKPIEVRICGISEVEIRIQSTDTLEEDLHLKLQSVFLGKILHEEGYKLRLRTVESKKFHGKYITDCEIVGLSNSKTELLKAFVEKTSGG